MRSGSDAGEEERAAGSAGIVLDTGKVAAAAAFAHASERAGGFAELSCAEGTLLPALRG